MSDDVPADIEALVRERRKIEAIRTLRQRTGLGLKEAKDRIDALERQLGLPAASVVSRRLLFLLVVIVVGALVFWWSSSIVPPR